MTGCAIFHIEQPDGKVVATAESHPNWALISPSLADSKRLAEPSLREHITASLSFAHYVVPRANADLRGDAA